MPAGQEEEEKEEEEDMTEENLQAVVRVTIPGRGAYNSYKFVFMKIAREIQPDALVHVYENLFGEPYPDPNPEDFDVVASIAWLKSCAIYQAFLDWRDGPLSYMEALDQINLILGDSSWTPSPGMLSEGRVF